MNVSLFATCLVDQFWPEVGLSTVRLLRRLGCEVSFDQRQTCCAQPAFNTGYRDEARKVARHFLEIFDGAEALVSPSGSCVAMVHHLPDLFEDDEVWRAKAQRVADNTFELGQFLVHRLKVEDVGARYEGKLTWHDACHGLRDLGIKDEPRRLIRAVQGAELVEMPGAESCCGFGGTFSVKYPEISVAMLDQKLQGLEQQGVELLVSGDVSCLMQISGRLERRRSKVKAMHLAQLLDSGQDAGLHSNPASGQGAPT